MKLSDFILLHPDQKKLAVLHDGILIGKRKKETCFIFLFQLDAFYVEMFCNLHDKTVSEFRSFENTAQLNPYLEQITLDGLL